MFNDYTTIVKWINYAEFAYYDNQIHMSQENIDFRIMD